MSVYKKLHLVQTATRALSANAEGQSGGGRYNYVSGSKLLGVLRPRMDELGLILKQEIIGIENTPITYTTRNGEKTEIFTTCHFRFTWIDTEDGSKDENLFSANGCNALDKGLGSSATYAERYFLMKFFHIATDEDDIDAIIKEDAQTIRTTETTEHSGAVKARRTARRARTETAPTPEPQTPEEPYTPMSTENYWKVVKAEAEGRLTKQGGNYRQTWIELTHAGEAQIVQFDADVIGYKQSRENNQF